jgi:peptide/nickel transport system ATP-binding protein/oligopeptide transport system ATP-binding protein
VVRQIADTVAVMYLGRFVETGPAQRVFAQPRHPYTRALLAAVPLPVPGARAREAVIGGDVPSPLAPPPGCHFHTRCPHAVERCRLEAPALETIDGGAAVACHRWRELDVAAGAARRPPHNATLLRLQAAFAERAA